MLAGHTHGGQIRVFGFAPVLPRGSGGDVSGWYRGDGRLPLYVSRGIGTSLIRARLGAPPEVSLFEIG
jgi:predicted MPP superfamily phosphohydrolase